MRFHVRPGVRRLFRLPPLTAAAANREVDDELAMLIANRVEHLIERGRSPDDAQSEALRHLGDSLDDVRRRLHKSVRQRERGMRVGELIDSVVQDVSYAARGLARRPAFTAVAVLTLAIGVGATTAIFSAINVLLLRPLPYARPGELMRVPLSIPADGAMAKSEMGWSYPMFTMFQRGQGAFAEMAPYVNAQLSLTSGDVERITGEYVGAKYLRVLGLTPARGRDFELALDAHAGAPRVAIISYALWQRRFAGDPSIVGRTLDIDRAPWTIVGVGPKDFRGLTGEADVLLPATTLPSARLGPNYYSFLIIARRRPSVTVSQAIAATSALGAGVAAAYPNPMGRLSWEVTALPLDDARLDPSIKRSLLVLFGAVVLVLLVACVNVANLLLGRASARRSEIAVRVAIGAGRGRLVRLLLTESLLLALIGGCVGVLVAWAGAHALGSINPTAVERASNVSAGAFGAVRFSSIALDWRALAFTFLVSLAVGVLFGFAPALSAARESLAGILKDGRRSVTGGVGRRALVVIEVALALVLLGGSGLMVRSLEKLLRTDAGFDGSNMLTFRATPPPGLIARDSMPGFYDGILDRVRAVPGVKDATLGGCAPLSGSPCGQWVFQRADAVIGGNIDMNRLIGLNPVAPNWFSTMHVPLKRGRMFTAADRAGAPLVVLLNESAAQKFFRGEDPIGKRVLIGSAIPNEVIGVVGGVRQRPDSAPGPTAYAPLAQAPTPGAFFFVRSSRAAASMSSEVRRAVHEVAPRVPVYDMLTMTQRAASATAEARFRAALLTAFAVTALSLAGIGLYGVISFAVTTRTREIGVRIALGAERGQVQRLVIGEGMRLLGVGAVIGACGTALATRLLRAFLFELSPADPITYASIGAVLFAVGIVAVWAPARRASCVDPVVALRTD
ncbi:MAG TPA: ABC transporter permease [Gemmatimonadaceae bacterium]|nr:ABC transporter permease [Gemmatimonadaceae bacterium]